MDINRRNAITKIIGFTGAAAGTSLISTPIMAAVNADGDYQLELGEKLQYVKIDPIQTAKLAYETPGGCMRQVFHAVIQMLANSGSVDAAKFATIPTALAAYGGGGVLGQGTICGNCNATGMLLNILAIPNAEGLNGKINGAIFRYYESTPLPYMDDEFVSAIGANPEDTATKVVSNSVANSFMCHSSISNWSDASGLGAKQKGERCRRLSACMAHYIAVLLNRIVDGEDVDLAAMSVPEGSAGECVQCHSVDHMIGDAPSVSTGMDCTVCHTGHFN
ncbi:cytochrome C [Paraferrimonas haliotis]|uniref:Cytochrome c n=1 Tax=Paraferrimonas haliotis TaxID=2013866 RepID=A0AA37WY19_9GAMM|nr:cytochrome C [Paraferrimonas haliotis]GLS82431.1 cytochrome c [Paraferrimonas haliotis]